MVGDVGREIMNENTRAIVAGAIMLLAQGVVAWAVWLSAWCMARNWSEGLGSVAMPLPTDIALRPYGVVPVKFYDNSTPTSSFTIALP